MICQIIAIKESLKMGMSTIQELYGNLKEHELELKDIKRIEMKRKIEA